MAWIRCEEWVVCRYYDVMGGWWGRCTLRHACRGRQTLTTWEPRQVSRARVRPSYSRSEYTCMRALARTAAGRWRRSTLRARHAQQRNLALAAGPLQQGATVRSCSSTLLVRLPGLPQTFWLLQPRELTRWKRKVVGTKWLYGYVDHRTERVQHADPCLFHCPSLV